MIRIKIDIIIAAATMNRDDGLTYIVDDLTVADWLCRRGDCSWLIGGTNGFFYVPWIIVPNVNWV